MPHRPGREAIGRVVRHFIYHVGEVGDLVAGPVGTGKSAAVRWWLEAGGDAAQRRWLSPDEAATELEQAGQGSPTFVVVDPVTDVATLRTLMTSTASASAVRAVLVYDGILDARLRDRARQMGWRVTTSAELEALRAG